MREATIEITGVHEYAATYPMLPEGELDDLAESIKVNGLRQPVVVTRDGLILDGRNRAAACERAGVKPTLAVYERDDLLAYVEDANKRRNMTAGARAMATAVNLWKDGKRKDGRWKRNSLHITGTGNIARQTWSNLMNQAGGILDYLPEVAPEVIAGDLSLDAAYQRALAARDTREEQTREAHEQAGKEAEDRAFITEHDPDLAARVGEPGSDLQNYTEARAVWVARHKDEAARLKAERAAAEREAEEHRQAITELYTSMATALQICADFGGYQDVGKLMGEYTPEHLNPPQLQQAFTVENLRSVGRFADLLIEWQEKRSG